MRNRFETMGRWLLAGVLAGMAGCVPSLNGNEPREPNKVVPGTYGDAEGEKAASAAQEQWDRFFQSPELRDLIATALKNNQELNIQLQELIIAKNEASARRGEYMPKVGVQAGAGVDKVGKYTSQGVSDEAHGVPETLGNFQFGLVGSWEVDVWGRLRNSAEAAKLRYLASKEGRNFLITQLVAELARSYYELVALDNELEILNANIEIQTNALEIVKLEKQAARVTELAVQRFEAEVLKNRSRLFEVQQQRVQAENRINFLVGRYPQPVKRNAADFLTAAPADLNAGVPSNSSKTDPMFAPPRFGSPPQSLTCRQHGRRSTRRSISTPAWGTGRSTRSTS
ncbi:MAG: TolC family protein [Polyangiales bacterium]